MADEGSPRDQPFEPVAALKHYHSAIDVLDFEAIEACFAPDAEYVSDGVGVIIGRDAIMAAFRGYFAVYGDQKSVDEKVSAVSPSSAWSRWRLEATHGVTGARLSRSGEEIVRFDAQGRIAKVVVQDDPVAP